MANLCGSKILLRSQVRMTSTSLVLGSRGSQCPLGIFMTEIYASAAHRIALAIICDGANLIKVAIDEEDRL